MDDPILAIDLGKFNSVCCWYEPASKAATFRSTRTTRAEYGPRAGRRDHIRKPGPAFVRTTSSVLSPDAFDQSCAVTRTDPRTSPSLEPHYPRVHCPARMPDRIVLAGCQPHHRPPKLDTTSARERGDHRQWIAPRLTGLQDGPAADEKLPRQRHDRLLLGQAVGEQTTPEGQRPAVVT